MEVGRGRGREICASLTPQTRYGSSLVGSHNLAKAGILDLLESAELADSGRVLPSSGHGRLHARAPSISIDWMISVQRRRLTHIPEGQPPCGLNHAERAFELEGSLFGSSLDDMGLVRRIQDIRQAKPLLQLPVFLAWSSLTHSLGYVIIWAERLSHLDLGVWWKCISR